ncbi:MAG: hypothetical protein AB4290_20765, partial [Spirulina sp.]
MTFYTTNVTIQRNAGARDFRIFNVTGGVTTTIDEPFTEDFEAYFDLDETRNLTLEEIQKTLQGIKQRTGINPAVIYAIFASTTITP